MTDLSILSGKTYFIRTFGCQMNLHDSERVSGLLDSLGCLQALDPKVADIVIFMTCCVREAADTRLYGQCSSCKSLPASPSGRRVVAVGGCIAQRDGEGLLTNVDNVNVIFGTHSIAHVGDLLAGAFADGDRHVRVEEIDSGAATDMPWHRETQYHAWVPIMTGCNNFCTYCIVPYVRGREKSRPFEEIVDEVTGLVRQGVRSVTLLGQKRQLIRSRPWFRSALRRAPAARGRDGRRAHLLHLPHPKDLLPETIDAMAEVPAVMPQLHLAVQSGSSRILKLMNRKYAREQYLDLVDRVRDRIPDIALTTDIIVGFPGETEEDFEQTVTLVDDAKFAQAFTFIYSKRAGTPAAKIDDPTPRSVIQQRFDRLVRHVETTAFEYNQRFLGATVPMLIEGTSKKNDAVLQGKSPWNQTVHCPVPRGHGRPSAHRQDTRCSRRHRAHMVSLGKLSGRPAMIPVLAITGPTAVGKSAVADRVALALGSEVLSADAMQVYRGMDIGTAKTPEPERLVPLRLVDLVEPDEAYSAAPLSTRCPSAHRSPAARRPGSGCMWGNRSLPQGRPRRHGVSQGRAGRRTQSLLHRVA